jgi:hypothetical protein
MASITDRLKQSYAKLNTFMKPQTGTLATAGRQFLSRPVPKQLYPLKRGVEGIYNTKNPAIALPMQFGAGGLQGQNLSLGQSPYRAPQNLPEQIAYGAGTLAGAFNPKGLTQRAIRPIVRATDPLISKAISPVIGKFAPGASRVVAGRAAAGVGNVVQGLPIDPLYGRKPGEGAAFDFATGALFGPGMFKAKGAIKQLKKSAPALDNLAAKKLAQVQDRILKNKQSIDDVAYVRDMGDKILDIPKKQLEKMGFKQIMSELSGVMTNDQRYAYQELPGYAGIVGKAKPQSTLGDMKGTTTFNAKDKVKELANRLTTEEAFKGTLDKEYVYFPKKGILMKTSEWNNIVKANQDSLKRNGIRIIKIIDKYGIPQPASSFLGDSLSSFYKQANVGRKLDSSRHLSDLFDLAKKTDRPEFQDAVKNAPEWERKRLFSGVDAYKKEGGKNLTFEEIWDLANKSNVAQAPKPQSTVGGVTTKTSQTGQTPSSIPKTTAQTSTPEISSIGKSATPDGSTFPKVYNAEASKKTTLKQAKAESQRQARVARNEYADWQRQVFKQENATQTTGKAVQKAAKAVRKATTSPVSNPEGLKDISGLDAYGKDVYRNFEKVYGSKFPQVKSQILDPFDQSKGRMVDDLNSWTDQLNKNVVQKHNIKRGSKESAAIQEFGEGARDYQSLVKQFGAKRADQIVEANNWFRKSYDSLLDEVNAVRKRIYPGQPDKIIPKRKDYYRHFTELSQGVRGLLNIFDSPANIQSNLSGLSEYTRPKSKWLSFAQKRLGNKTEVDAVGGFLDYLKAQVYAKNIDPHTARFRDLAEELATNTEDTRSLNGFIEYLTDFANDLSGKTNPADRFVQKVVGRKAFKTLNWINSRIKSNVILGNVSSAVAQIFNVPQGMAEGGMKHSIKGLGGAFASIGNDNAAIKKSNFIKERYSGNIFDQFDVGMLANTKKAAAWITGILDEVGSKYIWNIQYSKALEQGIPNPIKYADDITRKMVAGRGIGEVPLLQKSKLFQLAAPFTLEVGNLWHVMGDWMGKKEFGKLVGFFILSRVFNEGAKQIRGSDVSLDPINAMMEGYDAFKEEEDKRIGAMRFGGRVVGEALSNIPLGQTAAAVYPEYGIKIGGESVTRKELFGEGDPTRFGGTGLPGVLGGGIQDPLYKLIPPFAGQQIKRSIEGITTSVKGYSETPSGRVRFPVENNPVRTTQRAIFGQYSTPEAGAYFDNKQQPLGDVQSQNFKLFGNQYYNQVQNERQQEKQVDKYKKALESNKDIKGASKKSYSFSGEDYDGYVVGDKFIYTNEDGEVKTKSVESIKKTQRTEEKGILEANYSLLKDRLTRSKNRRDLYALNQQYVDYLKDYQKQLDPKKDAKEIITVQNKIEDLLYTLSKGVGGGGGKRLVSDAQLLSAFKKALEAVYKARKRKDPGTYLTEMRKATRPFRIKRYVAKPLSA